MPEQPEGRHNQPSASRPHMPGYGILDAASGRGLLPWTWAEERLTAAHNYFVVTTRPDGGPHAMPVWGVWLDGAFYFSSGRHSRKVRNLAVDPRCVVCPEGAAEAVILEGAAAEATDPALLKRVYAAYQAKYGMDMSGMGEPFFEVHPRVVFGLMENEPDFTGAATRWEFDEV